MLAAMASWRVVAFVLLVSTPAYAQRAEGEAEFQRGKSLMAAGKVAEACTAFEASMRIDPAKGTLYNLALCHEKLGKIASAWSEFVELSRTDTNAARAKDATKRAAALEPQLTRMHLVIASAADDEHVTRGELDVTALRDSDAPVDPGKYTFEATAPGRVTYSAEVALDDAGKTIEVRIPKLKKAKHDDQTPVEPDAHAGIVDEPAVYPQDLPHRPILIPHGMGEIDGNASVGTDSNYDRAAFYADASARARLGPFEARLVTGFILRAPFVMNKPNPWDAIGIGLRYPVGPQLVVGLDYTERQPLRAEIRGTDVAANVERKLLILPRVAVDGLGGLEFSQREEPGNDFAVFAAGQVQFLVVDRVSVEATARLDLHLAGDLYDYTAGLSVAARVVVAASPDLDIYGEAGNSLLPDAQLFTGLVGASWRPH
jgi:hypothetical protein